MAGTISPKYQVNRTKVELKLMGYVARQMAISAVNRTKVELK